MNYIMSFLWLYTLPNWALLCFLCTTFAVFGIIGFLITEPFVKRWLGKKQGENNTVSIFLYVIGVFYGMTLGLIAVGTWNSYSDTQQHILKEATLLAEFYKRADAFPVPYNKKIQSNIKNITYYIIHKAWPLHEKGIIPADTGIDELQKTLYTFSPSNVKEEIILQTAINLYGKLFEARMERVSNIKSGLPKELYWVLLIGAVINIGTTWLIISKKRSLHILTTGITGILIGSLIFLIVALDYPYRGEIDCISPAPYELVYTQTMSK